MKVLQTLQTMIIQNKILKSKEIEQNKPLKKLCATTNKLIIDEKINLLNSLSKIFI